MHMYNSVAKFPDRFAIRNSRVFEVMLFRDIQFIEAKGHYCEIVRVKQEKLLIHISIKSLEKALPENLFLRIHKSYIIYLPAITAFDHHHVSVGKKALPLSSSNFHALCERWLLIDDSANVLDEKIKKMSPEEYINGKRKRKN